MKRSDRIALFREPSCRNAWCETVKYVIRIKSPRSSSPNAVSASRPTRSFCVKGERIIVRT